MSVEPAGEVAELIGLLGLEVHPEGGWFRRTWTAPGPTGGRATASSILYLIDGATVSRWHRIDASELWNHAAGAPLELTVAAGSLESAEQGDRLTRSVLGPDLHDGHAPQAVVDPGHWQCARSLGEWSLAVCVVSPEFRFEGFELAPPDSAGTG